MSANDKQVAGVYQLLFPDGSSYIGASSNITVRIQTHFSWLRKGNGQTAKLQEAFDRFGTPKHKTLIVCARKHLGLYENLAHLAFKPILSQCEKGGRAGFQVSDSARMNMVAGALRKDNSCQAVRQLETWKIKEIAETRTRGMKTSWEKRKLDSVVCPYCNKQGNRNGMTRYHFENCKDKK